jgi:hypothetical protein
MLSVIMLSVVLLSVVAPFKQHQSENINSYNFLPVMQLQFTNDAYKIYKIENTSYTKQRFRPHNGTVRFDKCIQLFEYQH